MWCSARAEKGLKVWNQDLIHLEIKNSLFWNCFQNFFINCSEGKLLKHFPLKFNHSTIFSPISFKKFLDMQHIRYVLVLILLTDPAYCWSGSFFLARFHIFLVEYWKKLRLLQCIRSWCGGVRMHFKSVSQLLEHDFVGFSDVCYR